MCLTGTLSLAYFIHNCIVTIMQGNRHQENNVRLFCINLPFSTTLHKVFKLSKIMIQGGMFKVLNKILVSIEVDKLHEILMIMNKGHVHRQFSKHSCCKVLSYLCTHWLGRLMSWPAHI